MLTRRIFLENARNAAESPAPPPVPPPPQRGSHFAPPPPSPRFERDEETRRDRDDMVVRLARAETETDVAFRRIDESLRNLSRRMESSERSQNEAQRAMSSAAAEINTAARDQAQAFQHVTQRIDAVERNSDSAALRDAVRGLHQGLSRLADQIAKTANESSGQIALLAKNMDTLAGKLATVRNETGRLEKVVEDRFNALGDRLKHADRIEQFVEERLTAFSDRLKRSEERLDGDNRIEQTVALLQNQIQSSEERVQDDIARQLSSIERSIGTVSSRLEDNERRNDDGGVHAALQAMTQRLDRAERRKESDDGLQDTLRGFSQRFDAAERKTAEMLDQVRANLEESAKRLEAVEAAAKAKPIQPQPYDQGFEPIISNFDLPPFPDVPPFPQGDMMAREQLAPVPMPDMFAAPNDAAASPTTQDYLAQARRAAQAASHAGNGNGHGRVPPAAGGYAGAANVVDLEERKKTRRVSRPVAAAVLVLLALSAGLFVTRTFGPSNNIAGYAPGDQVALNTPPPAESNPPLADAFPPVAGTLPPQIPAPSFEPPPRPPAANSGTRVASAPPPPAAAAPITQFPPQRPAGAAGQLPPPTNNQFPPATAQTARPNGGAPAGFTPAPAPAAGRGPAGGTPQDRLMAKAGAGDVKAALLLGLKYADGDGIAVNDAEAARWLEKAATAGEPVAQYRLGTLYEKGRGVMMDAKQATRWYTEAARRGNRKAMHNLAVAYADGQGVEKSFTEAARWFKAASDLGLADSQFNLAVLYERGLGVGVSLPEAYKWYAIASVSGDGESKARVEALSSQIPAADKTAADRAAQAFKTQTLNLAANDPPALATVVQ